jgi:ribosomal protein L7/L12
MDLWAKMNEVLDDDVAQDVFMNMLGAGESGTTFRMQYGRCDVKVTAIKAVRQATGLGLKDAKELVEESQVQPARVQCQTAKEAIGLRKDLREIGMYIS